LRLQGTCLPPPPFHESISWIISPFKFWIATIFLHTHLQVVYYKCVKFHKNPMSRLGGVALTRYMDARTGRFLYTPPPKKTLFAGCIIINNRFLLKYTRWLAIVHRFKMADIESGRIIVDLQHVFCTFNDWLLLYLCVYL
jgi:hypothetical protein